MKAISYSKLNQMTSQELTTRKSIGYDDRGDRRKSLICVSVTVMRIFADRRERRIKSPISGTPAPFAMSFMFGRKDKRTNERTMFPALVNNAVAGCKGPVRKELSKSAGLPLFLTCQISAIKFPIISFCDSLCLPPTNWANQTTRFYHVTFQNGGHRRVATSLAP